ncbi:hypothetical protein [Actinomyces qiguomingii]|uniref:hypothetical protein n=1 Tax=Actinomyces qiguomingii TaxID=2057800 RepID=UPI000CA07336|nr:hypothetical protein [Actinomyces qiguomingii]
MSTSTNTPKAPKEPTAPIPGMPPALDVAGLPPVDVEAAAERRHAAVEQAVNTAYDHVVALHLCEPPATAPAWATNPGQLTNEAMAQVALTEQRAHTNGYYTGFVDAVQAAWPLARAAGYAEGQRDLARALAASHRAFLDEVNRALAASVDPTPRESIMERAVRERARLREAGVAA